MAESQDGGFPAGHYHSPIPSSEDLQTVQWKNSLLPAQGLDLNLSSQLEFLVEIAKFSVELDGIPEAPTLDALFCWMNPMLPPADALAYYAMIRANRPETIMEVGAGFSTSIALRAARKNGGASVVCVEPFPPDVLLSQRSQLHDLLEIPVQQVPNTTFERLERNDILFIDSSHVSKTGSDVNHLILGVLPILKPGVIVHFHDIFVPNEYPEFWLVKEQRYWNEQYLLLAFLLFNRRYEVLFSSALITQRYEAEFIRAAGPLFDKMPEVWRRDPRLGEPVIKAGSLWLRVR